MQFLKLVWWYTSPPPLILHRFPQFPAIFLESKGPSLFLQFNLVSFVLWLNERQGSQKTGLVHPESLIQAVKQMGGKRTRNNDQLLTWRGICPGAWNTLSSAPKLDGHKCHNDFLAWPWRWVAHASLLSKLGQASWDLQIRFIPEAWPTWVCIQMCESCDLMASNERSYKKQAMNLNQNDEAG